MIGATCGVVLLLIGAIFRSAFIPLRLVLTLLMASSFVFGLCELVFQEKIVRVLWPATADAGSLCASRLLSQTRPLGSCSCFLFYRDQIS